MSTVSVTNVKNASSSVNNAVTTSGGDLTNAAGVSFMSANKNLLYNGAMQVAQRATGPVTGITLSGYQTADRWYQSVNTLGTWTHSVENDAPTGSGLRRSLKLLCTTAKASPAAGDLNLVAQLLEGQDLQRIAKGTASAQQLTLSFWVKSNVTGTYVARLSDVDNSRHVAATYSISASATWEKKTITFPADATGAFDNDNALSMSVQFWLGAGSTYTSGTLATAWAANTDANAAVGQTNLAAATNNYWQVTGVQLEVGPVATSFEFKSFGQELRECQRYYYLHASGTQLPVCMAAAHSASEIRGYLQFPVTMRVAPSPDMSSGTDYYVFQRNGGNDNFNSIGEVQKTLSGFAWNNASEISSTAGHAGWVYTNNAASKVAFSAEL